jgi:nucleoside-diphosphate-sugar epimerase
MAAMDTPRVLVTGSDGRIGRVVVQDLRAHGYRVTPVDKYPAQRWGTKIVDCEDLGQVIGVMHGHQAVIHLAAIPSPGSHPADVVFRNNAISTFNILEAAAILGLKKIVLASSISAFGTAFGTQPFNPLSVPIDESHPLLSQDAYGLSKMVGEVLADGFCRRIPDLSVTSLRFSYVFDDEVRERLLHSPQNQPRLDEMLAGVFWTFVDVRDTASSCRLGLAYNQPGHEAFFINAPVILGDTPIEKLLARFYPGSYPVAAHICGNASPVDCGKAERLLGWRTRYDWEGREV